jgi:hypothetical protein
MTKRNVLNLFAFIFILAFIGCSEDDDNPSNNLNLNITGLEDLGPDARYEGWIIVDGSAISTGLFDVDANGNLSETSFEIDASDLDNASTFVLTIEPNPDPDPAPSDVHILAGDFNGESASLNIHHGAALANDFSGIMGQYILATPTDGMDNNENSGVWFLSLESGSPSAGLDLPSLPNGWAYEGWAVIDGQPISTGVFTSASGADDASIFSGAMPGPPFPGEDFLQNAPAGLSFPTDLSGATIVVSVEPVPDNSPAPFTLKPLVHNTPANAQDHVTFDMDQNLTFPMGNASR